MVGAIFYDVCPHVPPPGWDRVRLGQGTCVGWGNIWDRVMGWGRVDQGGEGLTTTAPFGPYALAPTGHGKAKGRVGWVG